MHDVERVDRDFLSRRGLEAHGSLYEADPPLEFGNPGGNLTPLPSLEQYRTVYQHHAGPWSHDDLIVLIEDVLQRDKDALEADFDKIVAVDDVLAYLAVMAVVQNHDMVRKNYYLYHQVDAADKRWRLVPWDLDLSWGHLWSEENDILEEKIVSDSSMFVGTFQGHSFYNQLIDRLLTSPTWRPRYMEFVKHLIEGPADEAVIGPRIDTMICHLGLDLLADPQKRAANGELAQRFGELQDFLVDRRAFLAKSLLTQP
jgi:spore coat protein CotH